MADRPAILEWPAHFWRDELDEETIADPLAHSRCDLDHSAWLVVHLVCTGNGQHQPRGITSTAVTKMMDGSIGRGMIQTKAWRPPDPHARPHSGASRESFMFRCPLCPGPKVVRRDRWWALIDKLNELQTLQSADGTFAIVPDHLDISGLP